jgi:hypothetical protein
VQQHGLCLDSTTQGGITLRNTPSPPLHKWLMVLRTYNTIQLTVDYVKTLDPIWTSPENNLDDAYMRGPHIRNKGYMQYLVFQSVFSTIIPPKAARWLINNTQVAAIAIDHAPREN